MGQGHEGAARELSRRRRRRGIEVEVRDFLDALPMVGQHLTVTAATAIDDVLGRPRRPPGGRRANGVDPAAVIAALVRTDPPLARSVNA